MRELKVLRLDTNCGACVNKCCNQPLDWVYVTSRESAQLRAASGIPESEFVVERLQADSGYVVNTLKRPCSFLDSQTGDCTVYESRPLACRLFPFHVDPFTGDATLYPVECDDNMIFPPANSDQGWRLIDLEDDVRRWLAELRDEIRLEIGS
jgi:Fe-S-cluster containining protein